MENLADDREKCRLLKEWFRCLPAFDFKAAEQSRLRKSRPSNGWENKSGARAFCVDAPFGARYHPTPSDRTLNFRGPTNRIRPPCNTFPAQYHELENTNKLDCSLKSLTMAPKKKKGKRTPPSENDWHGLLTGIVQTPTRMTNPPTLEIRSTAHHIRINSRLALVIKSVRRTRAVLVVAWLIQ